jgi:hypothetical protein
MERDGHVFWDAADAWIAEQLAKAGADADAGRSALRTLDEMDEGGSSRN